MKFISSLLARLQMLLCLESLRKPSLLTRSALALKTRSMRWYSVRRKTKPNCESGLRVGYHRFGTTLTSHPAVALETLFARASQSRFVVRLGKVSLETNLEWMSRFTKHYLPEFDSRRPISKMMWRSRRILRSSRKTYTGLSSTSAISEKGRSFISL